MNELEYMVNNLSEENSEILTTNEEGGKKKERGLMNAQSVEKMKKLIDEELINSMRELVSGESLYTQIIFADYVIMFLSCLCILSSIVNYEMNFNNSNFVFDWSSIKNEAKNMIYAVSLIFNTFASLIIGINIYFRHVLTLSYDKLSKTLTEEDDLFSSRYYKYIIYEILLILPHPNIIAIGVNFNQTYTNSKMQKDIISYQVNDILLCLIMFRMYFVLKYIITKNYYKSSRAVRICKMYGEPNTCIFAVKSIFNKNPMKAALILFISGVIFYSINLRIFERVFTVRNQTTENIKYQMDFDNIANTGWCVIMIMLTVSYGDFYPKSVFGRLVVSLAIIHGIVIISLIVVSFFKALSLDSTQTKIYILLERMLLRTKFENLQKDIVSVMLWKNFIRFKVRKMNEKLETLEPEENKLEMIKIKKNLELWNKKKIKCEVKMRHMIRLKNETAK